MESAQRPEIANSHVPLAFLLGRRASEYSLPRLGTNSVRRQKPRDAALVHDNKGHLHQRETLAKQLLARVLAQEARLDPKQEYEPDTPMEAPLARVSTADRRRRAVELQRVLSQDEAIAAATAEICVLTSFSPTTSSLYDPRKRFASTHGYVPSAPTFVEVIGNPARIQRAHSLRQFHENEKRQRIKQFNAKQSRISAIKVELLAQQTDTKAKLRNAEQSLTLKNPHEESVSTPKVPRHGADAIRQKQKAVKHWQDEQQRQLELTKEEEQRQLQHRHELVQRARYETEAAVKARQASSQFEKKTMAKIRGVGPSFASVLRVEPADKGCTGGATVEGPLLLEVGEAGGSNDTASSTEAARDHDLGDRLHARQYELFQQSQTRSVRCGGGFASKPRNPSDRKHESDGNDDNAMATTATAVSFTKTKRQVQDEWRRTISTQH